MDWKTKALVFVLVLFGPVVPVSAQSEGAGGMTAEVWAILGVGVVLLGVLVPLMIHFNNVNHGAHEKIGRKIEGVKTDIKEDISRVEGNVGRVEGKIEGVKTDIKEDISRVEGNVGRVEGKVDEINIYLRDSATEAVRLGRQSETRKD